MGNYALQSDEVVIYKNECRLIDENVMAELILTNFSVVIIKKAKKLFEEEQVAIEAYPIDEIKIYNDIPQIKQNGSHVEIFFTGEEIAVDLISKNEVSKFINKALELLTGKNRVKRASDKVKSVIGVVDDTLGINSVEALKNVAGKSLGGAVFGIGKKILTKAIGAGSPTEAPGVASDSLGKEAHNPKIEVKTAGSVDNLVEVLKKWKDLMDAGVITNDEFETKKKQILGL